MTLAQGPVEVFQELLRLQTISGEGPAGSYQAAAAWLQEYAEQVLHLPARVVSLVPDKPVVVVTWQGTNPELPRLVLNSHYDVVPVMREHWTVDPFSAQRTKEGRIYGRGAQDMKCVCVQYLEAVRRLRSRNFQPTRTVFLTFVPDEEIGGAEGMGTFLGSDMWRDMQPVGLALDEGLANPGNAYTVFYGERTPWWLLVKATGNTGHGSRFIDNTAMSKLVDVCNQALRFRQEQRTALNHSGGCSHASAKKLGDVSTVNLTMLKGGVSSDGGKTYALNVIPIEAEAGFDVRVSPTMHPGDFRALMDEWCKEEGVSWQFAPWTRPIDEHYLTSLDREENPWWGVFLDTMKEVGVDVEPEIFPAGTDSRFLRQLGISALGFSPMRNTPILLHDHDEYIDEAVFLEGILVYEKLIANLAAADRFPGEGSGPVSSTS